MKTPLEDPQTGATDSSITSSSNKFPDLESISKAFGSHTVLEDLCLHVDQGELASLSGVSGSGKTTLFNIIAGLLKPDQGQVLLEGKDITGQAGQVAYILQKDLLLPHLKILDNVALPLSLEKVPKDQARGRAQSYFQQFGLVGTEGLYPSEISGGTAQRAALLRTYLLSSKIALLGEPFSKLDAITKAKMHDWYLKIMEEIQLTILFIGHDIDEAIHLNHRTYVLSPKIRPITKEYKLGRTSDFQSWEGLLYQTDLKKQITQDLG